MPSKHLSNFWRTLEELSINCEINLISTCSEKCVLSNDTKVTTFPINDTKRYVLVVTLSSQDNAKLLQQLKSSFERTIIWNKYQPKISLEGRNPYLDFLKMIAIDLRKQRALDADPKSIEQINFT